MKHDSNLVVGATNGEFTNDKLVSFYITHLVVNIFSVSDINGEDGEFV